MRLVWPFGEIAYNQLSLEYAFGHRANQDLCASDILKVVDNAYQTWFASQFIAAGPLTQVFMIQSMNRMNGAVFG